MSFHLQQNHVYLLVNCHPFLFNNINYNYVIKHVHIVSDIYVMLLVVMVIVLKKVRSIPMLLIVLKKQIHTDVEIGTLEPRVYDGYMSIPIEGYIKTPTLVIN